MTFITRLQLAWQILFGPPLTGEGETTSRQVAAIAARGLRRPRQLTEQEIKAVCASALKQAPDTALPTGSVKNGRWPHLIAGMIALLAAGPPAGARDVNCAELAAALAAPAGGALRLVEDCGKITARASHSPPLVVDAGRHRVAGLVLAGAHLDWRGGIIRAPKGTAGKGPDGYAISIRGQHISVAAAEIELAARGVVIDRAGGVTVSGLLIREPTVDGINVANSHRVTITGNSVISFSTGEIHPDCIQGWTRAGLSMADVTVTGNFCLGQMQGIFFGNHLTRQPPDPGFDRITITGNVVASTYPQGINLSDCRACQLTGNQVRTLPGARHRSSINPVRTTGTICGNTAQGADPRRIEVQPCR